LVILTEKKPAPAQPLEEMAQFKGAGIVVEVRSNDHGKLGSPGSPAHAHVLDSSGSKELAEIIITVKPPQKPADVFYYRTDKIPDGLSKTIVKFAGMIRQSSSQIGSKLTNWQAVVYQWDFFHGK
jgi:hypothetical protein